MWNSSFFLLLPLLLEEGDLLLVVVLHEECSKFTDDELKHDLSEKSVDTLRRMGVWAADAENVASSNKSSGMWTLLGVVLLVVVVVRGLSSSDRPAAQAMAFLLDEDVIVAEDEEWRAWRFHPAFPPLLGKIDRRGVTMPVVEDWDRLMFYYIIINQREILIMMPEIVASNH